MPGLKIVKLPQAHQYHFPLIFFRSVTNWLIGLRAFLLSGFEQFTVGGKADSAQALPTTRPMQTYP